MPPAVNASLDTTAILLAVAGTLLGGLIVVAGYVWKRTVKAMEDQHASAIAMVNQVQEAAMTAIKEFREQNRHEHEAFESRFRAVEHDLAFMKGREAGEKNREG